MQLYPEFDNLHTIILVCGAAFYWLMLAFYLFLVRVIYVYHHGHGFSWAWVGVPPTVLTVLNLAFGFYINVWVFGLIALVVSTLSLRWIPRFSLKWITASVSAFMYLILGLYVWFNASLSEINWSSFQYFGIGDYHIAYKPFLQLSFGGKPLHEMTFTVDGQAIVADTWRVYARSSIFYYSLCAFAVVFWWYVYVDMLRRHGFWADRHKMDKAAKEAEAVASEMSATPPAP